MSHEIGYDTKYSLPGIERLVKNTPKLGTGKKYSFQARVITGGDQDFELIDGRRLGRVVVRNGG